MYSEKKSAQTKTRQAAPVDGYADAIFTSGCTAIPTEHTNQRLPW